MGRQFVNDRILVVDDFPSMRMSIRRMLRELGEERVDLAANGEEAIKALRRTPYDIILCDYNLGEGKDGQQVLEEGRHMGLIPPAAVFVMITAETSARFVLGALEYQPDDYIAKPFTKELLALRLKKLTERAEALRDIQEAIGREEYLAAIELCEQRLAEKGKYLAEVARLLGELYLRVGDHQRAVTTYEKILNRRSFHWARFGLAKAFHFLGEHARAANLFEELLADNRNFIEAYDWLARARLAAGDGRRAQEVLAQALALSSKSVGRQRELGRVALCNEDLETAERAFRAAIREGEHSALKQAEEYTSLTDILMQTKRSQKALTNLKKAREAFRERPDDQVQVLASSAEVLEAQGKHEEAAQMLEQASQLYRTRASEIGEASSLKLARTALAFGDEGLARTVLGTLVRNNHDEPEYLDKARALLEEAGAGFDVDELIDGSAEEMRALNARGIELAEQGDLAAAMALFEEAAEGAPSNRSFNLNAAQVMIQMMQQEGVTESLLYKARQYLERVARAGKSDERHKQLTRMYQDLRNGRVSAGETGNE